MKKIFKTFLAILTLLLLIMGCSERGPIGPEGPRGPQGPQGPDILPTAFDFYAYLLEENNFEHIEEIPNDIEIYDSEVILVFVLEAMDGDLEVWRKLPITEFTARGTLLFDYDFTLADIRLFLDANYNLGSNDGFNEILFRAVHIPANYLAKMPATVNVKNVESPQELESILGVEIRKIN